MGSRPTDGAPSGCGAVCVAGGGDVAVTVVIKALNEEAHVARAVASAWTALAVVAEAGFGAGEVILADSRSTDRTAAIAAAGGARVARLADDVPRSCGIGPQLGYQHARGRFVCLIDGDMVLDPGFLSAGLRFLGENPEVAGVGGGVRDVNVVNLEFKRRALRGAVDLQPGSVDRLNGGGLYRREAIEQVGHFSDRNLHGYEEFDLAVRLRAAGWRLHRLAVPFVDHYGHVIGGYALLRRRIESRYLDGIGEMLRAAIGRPHLRMALRDLPEIRLWLGVYLGWLVAAGLAVAVPGLAKLVALVALMALPIAALGLRYRSLPLGLYAFVAWNAHAFGMARGFLGGRVAPGERIASTVAEPATRHDAASPAPRDVTPGRAAKALAICAGLAIAVAAAAPIERADARPAEPTWVALRDRNLAIAEGSPLDFSGLGPLVPAGTQGRVIAGPSGNLALADDPATRVPFLCASLAWSPASGSYPDKPTAERYARQLRIHGYNLARLHFADAILMTGRSRDFDLDPEQFDRLRYLLAALKRNGIYWMIDGLTSQSGGLGGIDDRWGNAGGLKLGVHVDGAARAHWRRLVRTIYGSVNPYTGLSPLHDSALALVVLANENGVEFDTILAEKDSGQAYPDMLRAPFNAWLKTTYRGNAALRSAWGDLGAGESLEAGTVRLPTDRYVPGPRMRDLKRFFVALETDTVGWMTGELATLGYSGLVSAYNNGLSSQTDLSRAPLPVVSMNAYFDEVLSFDPGTTISQKSSLDDAAGYLRELVGRRRFGTPFVVTEYDHLFWNRFRREAGLVVPAYAALQGWDAICRHAAGPIDLTVDQPWPHKRRLLPFGISLDPVARAGETLAALLFRRGDVAAAQSGVALPFGTTADLVDDGFGGLPDSVTKLGLLTRFGLVPHSGERVPAGVATLPALSQGTTPSFAADRAAIRDDASDEAAGLYGSVGGQILLDARARRLQVVTPRTVAASYAAVTEKLRLGPLTIEAGSGPALLAASALDGRDLIASRRMLLIFATDARNTGMRFRDTEARTIENFGEMPILIERQTARLRFALDAPREWRLRSLHLDGTPGDAIAMRTEANTLVFDLDNTATSHGPTTFFLMERS
ncbi:glycosyltransferase [Methylobacterium sp. WL9]|uniref:glycosyltransferase n=1 Tax=Methylobacterium sp. WL9 TaxID=2603898 RepID=UPI001AEE8C5A|nr:glycosyltransferase [Methylobacterium sp. WL9]